MCYSNEVPLGLESSVRNDMCTETSVYEMLPDPFNNGKTLVFNCNFFFIVSEKNGSLTDFDVYADKFKGGHNLTQSEL